MLFKMVPNTADTLSSFPKCRKAVVHPKEKMVVLNKLHSGSSYKATGRELKVSESKDAWVA